MKTLTKEQQKKITPDMAIELLKTGNERFVNNLKINRNLLQQVDETAEAQHPFAVIISCMDSRTSPELIFDQGLGDIFSIRIAGNVINEEIIASSEFGCKLIGAKVIVVLGHTQCGAVKGAISDVQLGHLHFVTKKIQRCLPDLRKQFTGIDDGELCKHATRENVFQGVEDLRALSPILAEMEEKEEIRIVGGIYDVSTGQVEFYAGASLKPSFVSENKHSTLVEAGV